MSAGPAKYNGILIVAVALVALPLLASCCMGQSAVGPDGTVTDVLTGRNNKGPYTLSWTDIDARTVSVMLGARTLKKKGDYNLDAAKGVISFNSMLVQDAIVRVTYKITQGKSKANSGKVDVPVSLDIVSSQDTRLNVTGLYAQDDPNKPDAGKTIVGLSGDKTWSNTKVNSQFLMSQRTTDDEAGDDSGAWDKSAFKMGSETKLGGLTLSGAYLHAGNKFAGAKEYGTGLGKDTTDLAAVYSNDKSFQAAFKFKKTGDTNESAKGAYSEVNEQSIAYSPSDATKISMVRSTTETGNASGTGKTVDTSAVKVDQSIGAKTNAVASFENSKITNGNTTDEVQVRQVAVNTSAAPGVNVKASATQKESQLHGGEQNVNAAVTATVIPQIAVQANFSTTESDKNGDSSKSDVNLQIKPADNVQIQAKLSDSARDDKEQYQREVNLSSNLTKNTKLTAEYSQRGMNEKDDVTKGAALEMTPFTHTRLRTGFRYVENGEDITTIRDYAAETNPWNFFSLSGMFRDRESRAGLLPDTKKVKMALSPLACLRLTGDYQENPEDNNGAIQALNSTSVGLKMSIGSVGVLTDYSTRDEYKANRSSEERKVGIELPAFGRGKLSTGFKESRLLNTSESMSRTYSMGYRHDLGGDFNISLSGHYTRYMQQAMPEFDKAEAGAEASLGLKF